MSRTLTISLVFLLTNTLVSAQQQAVKRASGLQGRPEPTNCPMGVEASFAGLPSVANAGPSTQEQPTPRKGLSADALQLHLNVSNPSPRDIVGAAFKVHGFSRKVRVFDLSDPSNAPDIAKTVDVALDVQGNGHAASELALTHFAAVITSLDLVSVIYADGIPWQASSPADCRIYPNMVVRIAAAR